MPATNFLTTRLISHRERVCSLYKKSLRLIEAYIVDRAEYRYRAVIMRSKFETNRNMTDLRKAVELVEQGEEELFLNQHAFPFQYQYSPGGTAYSRDPPRMDWLLDMWHPLEKASYPHYFARREKRKDEWIEFWKKNYNNGKEYDEHEPEFHGSLDEPMPSELPPITDHRLRRPGFPNS